MLISSFKPGHVGMNYMIIPVSTIAGFLGCFSPCCSLVSDFPPLVPHFLLQILESESPFPLIAYACFQRIIQPGQQRNQLIINLLFSTF